jgi:hypothetical protein
MQLLTTAYNHGAADRVGNLFRAFLASRIPSRERTSTRLPHEGTGPRPAVRASAGVNEARRRVFAKGEIAKFYDECRRGVYDKREDERWRIEQEIFKAAQQGRVADNAVQPKHRGQLF